MCLYFHTVELASIEIAVPASIAFKLTTPHTPSTCSGLKVCLSSSGGEPDISEYVA